MKTIKADVFSTSEMAEFPISKIKAFRPSVYGIVQHKNRLLLLHQKHSNKLTLPGGGIDLGETIEQALKRELLEETGLQVKVGGFLGFSSYFFYYDPADELLQTFLFYYECNPLTTDLLPDDQIDDIEAEKPRWTDWQALKSSDFQVDGEKILSYLKTGDR